jgi:hypothetical protein
MASHQQRRRRRRSTSAILRLCYVILDYSGEEGGVVGRPEIISCQAFQFSLFTITTIIQRRSVIGTGSITTQQLHHDQNPPPLDNVDEAIFGRETLRKKMGPILELLNIDLNGMMATPG